MFSAVLLVDAAMAKPVRPQLPECNQNLKELWSEYVYERLMGPIVQNIMQLSPSIACHNVVVADLLQISWAGLKLDHLSYQL